MLLFVILIFVCGFANCNINSSLVYEKVKISKGQFEFEGLNLHHNLLKIHMKKLVITSKRIFQFNQADFKFEDAEQTKWNVKIEQGYFDENLKNLNNITAQSNDGALINIKNLTVNDHANVEDGYITPCSNAFCWNASCSNLKINKTCALLKGSYFGVEKLKFPWFDTQISFIPASGFLSPKFSIDEFDGVILDVPYYYLIDDKKDLIFTPSIGQKIGLGAQYRQLAFSSIISAKGDFNILERAAYLNIKNEALSDNDNFDMNLLLYTSKRYAQYWDNKENGQNRLYIPSYLYYSYEPIRLSLINFINTRAENDLFNQNNDSAIVPKLVYQDKFKLGNCVVKLEGSINSNFYDNKRFSKKNITHQGNGLASIGINKIILDSLLTKTELGIKSNQHGASNNSYLFLIEQMNFPLITLKPIAFMPYVNGKFIASINESKSSNKWENHFLNKTIYHIDSNFFESYEPKLKNASFDIGTLLFPYSFNTQNNIEFDLGFKHDSKSNYGIVGAQFSNDLGYVFIKDYINDNHNFIITTGVNRKNFGLRCEYQAFDFENELNHKINANVYLQLTRDVKININGLYRVKPNQELVNSGIKIIFTSKCWVFSAGVNYGHDWLSDRNSNRKTRITLSVALNGFDKIQNAMYTMENFKHEIIDFSKKL